MTTVIPCRAKDPHTCKYHSAEIRANEALDAGDIDAYLIAQAEMTAAIKTTPEVVEFFANRPQQPSSVIDRFNDHLAALKPEPRLQTAIDAANRDAIRRDLQKHLNRAADSLDERIQRGTRPEPSAYYTVGGTVTDIEEEPYTTARTVYQATAQRLLGLATLEAANGITELGVDRERLIKALDQARNDHLDDAEEDTAPENLWREVDIAHRYGYKMLLSQYNNPIAPGGKVNRVSLRRLLNALDKAYWEQPAPSGEGARLDTPIPAAAPLTPAKQKETAEQHIRNVGIQVARGNLKSRIRANLEDGVPYNVGGLPTDTKREIATDQRIAYQDAAEAVLKNAGVYATGGGTWTSGGSVKNVIRMGKFEAAFSNRYQAAVNEAAEREDYGAGESDAIDQSYDNAGRIVRDAFANNRIDNSDLADITGILTALDKAYWQKP